jgi:hypothetical protein
MIKANFTFYDDLLWVLSSQHTDNPTQKNWLHCGMPIAFKVGRNVVGVDEGEKMLRAVLSDLFKDLASGSRSEKNRTPEDIYENLFKSFLRQKDLSEVSQDREVHSTRRLKPGCNQIGFLLDFFKLPPTIVPKLVQILKHHRLSQEEIDGLIRKATDKEGYVRLDQLLIGLNGKQTLIDGVHPKKTVEGIYLPQLEGFLLEAGLAVSEVKGLVEKSVDREGDVKLNRFFAALSKELGDPQSQKSLMSAHGISESSTRTSKQVIKEILASILREKNLSTENVKTILETLSIAETKTLSTSPKQSLSGLPLGRTEDLPEGLSKLWGTEILNQAKLKPTTEMQGDVVTARFLSTLTKEPANGLKPTDRSQYLFMISPSDDQGDIMFHDHGAGSSTRGGRIRPAIEPGLMGNGIYQEALRNLAGRPLENRENAWSHAAAGANSAYVRGHTPVDHLPEPLPRLVERMIWMAQGGIQRSRIHLSPPDLGRLELRLIIEHGHLRAQIGAETLWAKEIIDSNMTQLRQQLSDMGFVVDHFDVMNGLSDPGSQGKHDMWGLRERDIAEPNDRDRLKAKADPRISDNPVLDESHQIHVTV